MTPLWPHYDPAMAPLWPHYEPAMAPLWPRYDPSGICLYDPTIDSELHTDYFILLKFFKLHTLKQKTRLCYFQL